MNELVAEVPGGSLRIRFSGPEEGDRLLFLHGGPGLSDSYLDPLIAEFADTYRVATYAQRGVSPSTATEPFDLAVQADDAIAVLDALGWSEATVIGHSWGGHLLLHVLAVHADRVRFAVAIDPLGGVGDGGAGEFGAELLDRLSPDARARLEEPDLSSEDQLQVIWPSYFPPRSTVPEPTPVAFSSEASSAGWQALEAALPTLAERLRGVQVPTLFIRCEGSPMPATASTETASAIGAAASVVRIEGGHFPWLINPRTTRATVDAFLSGRT